MKRAALAILTLTLALVVVAALTLKDAPAPTAPGLSVLEQALYASAAGDLDRARELFKLHSEARPEDFYGRLMYARCCVETGRIAEAGRILDQIEPKGIADVSCALLRARVARLSGQPELAVSVLSREAAERPKSAILWRELGLLQHELGQSMQALSSIQRSLQLDPAQEDLARLAAELSMSASTGDFPRGRGSLTPELLNPASLRPPIPGTLPGGDPRHRFPAPSRPRPERGLR
jgi:tetratricopeptide (TPR) repeat protein